MHSHDKIRHLSQWLIRPILLSALLLSIPAFYLILTGSSSFYRHVGHGLYAVVAILLALDVFWARNKTMPADRYSLANWDWVIFLGALASIWPTDASWSVIEWWLRLTYCGIIFIRLTTLFAHYIAPHRLLQTCILAMLMLAVAGAGFFWLEPGVHTYADGVWLAFITGATVGYGDLVPSTPASRIFAIFIVLLGYALFSIVTASIAALLVGEDEKRLRRELHTDIRLLQMEIAALRVELRNAFSNSDQGDDETRSLP